MGAFGTGIEPTKTLHRQNMDCSNCNYILFTKLHWPGLGGSEGTFWSSSQTAHLCTTHGGGFTLIPLIAERQAQNVHKCA